jgi:hypothetical protein
VGTPLAPGKSLLLIDVVEFGHQKPRPQVWLGLFYSNRMEPPKAVPPEIAAMPSARGNNFQRGDLVQRYVMK